MLALALALVIANFTGHPMTGRGAAPSSAFEIVAQFADTLYPGQPARVTHYYFTNDWESAGGSADYRLDGVSLVGGPDTTFTRPGVRAAFWWSSMRRFSWVVWRRGL